MYIESAGRTAGVWMAGREPAGREPSGEQEGDSSRITPLMAGRVDASLRGGRLAQQRQLSALSVFELYCMLAAMLGGIGFGLTIVAAYDEACGVLDPSSGSS